MQVAVYSIHKFEKDYLEKYHGERKIFGQVQDKYFIDIGIPEDFEKANIDFSTMKMSPHVRPPADQ